MAHFDDDVCQACPFIEKCPVQRGKRDTRFHLRFTQNQVNMSQRRQNSLIHQEEGRNLRAAVESTVRQVKHSFPAGKLSVRGRFRVTCMLIGSAMTANVRRIQRYLEASIKAKEGPKRAGMLPGTDIGFFFCFSNCYFPWLEDKKFLQTAKI